ncbi:MAG TPA: prephenate dehydrogenase [Longimicrobiales bacterium]|nr:prephenate dehydrogenase [Longimicrobiales bacterium]
MTELRTVALAGLGLMGGSLARDLTAAGVRVLGMDEDAGTVAAARAAGAIADRFAPNGDGIGDVDAVVLAVPVQSAIELLRDLAPKLAGVALITDVGGTKASIVAAAEAANLGARFVGSHPMAGDHRAGWAASRNHLYRNAPVYLCPAAGASPETIAHAVDLWAAVGATTQVMDPAEHDRRMGWISHLPQAAATALARVLAGAGFKPRDLGPGGRDTTRLAASSPDLWTEIALDNTPAMLQALGALEMDIAELRRALGQGDAEHVRAIFEAGRAWAEGEGASA